MIEVKNLHKEYKNIVAVQDVSLYMEAGESVGLLAPNGAGKSTTISMISTLLPPTKGTITYNGLDVFEHPEELRPILGVVPLFWIFREYFCFFRRKFYTS